MPPTCLPTPSAVPQVLHPVIHPPSPDKTSISNILILLHGLGDTSTNFSAFPAALNLPATLTITLQGPTPLPFPLQEGYHYGDGDILVDSSTGQLDPGDGPFEKARKLVSEDVIRKVLIGQCGFRAREILILGFGQGGMLALAIAKDFSIGSARAETTSAAETELGGVISIGGRLPRSAMLVNGEKSRTPILLLGGSKGTFAAGGDDSAVKSVKGTFAFVEFHRWKKADDGMMRNREETLPLMQFLARRLRSRQGVPEGAVEIG